MKNKILIAYASRCGSTAEVAQSMAKTLQTYGEGVDVYPVERIKDLSGYKCIITGSAVRKSQWLPEAVKFVKDQRLVLRRVPTAYFTICLRMAEDSQANRRVAAGYLSAVYAYNHADLEGFFGGCLDFNRLSWLERTIMKRRTRDQEGDYRDWDAIRAWTDDVYRRLLT